jgi:ResB-like family protein
VGFRLVRGDAPPAPRSGLSFALGADGVLRCLADVDMAISDMSSGEVTVSFPANEAFAVDPSSLYRSGDSWVSFVVQEVFPHVQRQPGMSDNDRAPAAALVSVIGPNGERGETIVTKDSTRPFAVALGDKEVFVKMGAIRIPVPYSVALDDFLLLNYPGSRNPASYESHVKLYDPDKGIDGRAVRIYMNHPMDHRGFKHFQSSYDTDEQGTILSVNYDPGKLPTYFGYILISLGFVLVFMRDLLWPRKDTTTEGAGDEV